MMAEAAVNGVDITAYLAVLYGPKTGSSAVGALMEAVDLIAAPVQWEAIGILWNPMESHTVFRKQSHVS